MKQDCSSVYLVSCSLLQQFLQQRGGLGGGRKGGEEDDRGGGGRREAEGAGAGVGLRGGEG